MVGDALRGPGDEGRGAGQDPGVYRDGRQYDEHDKLEFTFYNVKSWDQDRALNGQMMTSAAEGVAYAKSVVAGKPDPSLYEIIDLTS